MECNPGDTAVVGCLSQSPLAKLAICISISFITATVGSHHGRGALLTFGGSVGTPIDRHFLNSGSRRRLNRRCNTSPGIGGVTPDGGHYRSWTARGQPADRRGDADRQSGRQPAGEATHCSHEPTKRIRKDKPCEQP
jgi:hypothetical protein